MGKDKLPEQILKEQLHDIPFRIDMTNGSRFHLWYDQKFGDSITPYRSVEESVASWPTTASAIRSEKEKWAV